MPINVATLEDDPIVQSFLADLLQTSDECTHVGAAQNRAEALELIEQNLAEVYLVDMHLPDVSGIELIRHIKQLWPAACCLVLSSVSDRLRIRESIEAGAGGYVLKDDHPDALIEKIVAIHQGNSPLSPRVANVLVQDIAARPADADAATLAPVPAPTTLSSRLTRREFQILQKLNSAAAIKQIADELHISPFTVNQHIQHIYRKLNVRNRSAAVIKANELKII